MNEIKLYEFIELSDSLDLKFLGYRHTTFNVPTEFVVMEPKICTPQVAKAYFTRFYFYDNKVMDYKALNEAVDKFRGTSNYDGIRLVEVWFDCGEDGHTEYHMRGWMFVPQSHLDRCMKMKSEWEGLPICMTWGNGWDGDTYIDEFNRRWERYKEKLTSTE